MSKSCEGAGATTVWNQFKKDWDAINGMNYARTEVSDAHIEHMVTSSISDRRLHQNRVGNGIEDKTSGGLTKKQLVQKKDGGWISKKQHQSGVKIYKALGVNGPAGWTNAMIQAREELKIEGFVVMNKGVVGEKLYKRTKQIFEENKDCEKGKIVNPKTGNCVKIDGEIGRKIVAKKK